MGMTGLPWKRDVLHNFLKILECESVGGVRGMLAPYKPYGIQPIYVAHKRLPLLKAKTTWLAQTNGRYSTPALIFSEILKKILP